MFWKAFTFVLGAVAALGLLVIGVFALMVYLMAGA